MDKQPEEMRRVFAGVTPARACAGVFLALLFALALDGSSLEANAGRLPYGPMRDFWLTAARPAGAFARWTRLDGFRNLLAGTVGARLNAEPVHDGQ